MEQEQFKILLERYKADAINQEEWDELRIALSAPEMKELLEEDMIATFSEGRSDPDWDADREEQLFHFIRKRVYSSSKIFALQTKRWWIAAAVIVTTSIGGFLWFFNSARDHEALVVQNQEIVPGRSGATLTLADGSNVLLDSVSNGIVALQGGKTVKIENGSLKYEGYTNNVMFNTISTPNGRQFHLTLPDGSNVWLNNASSVRYPIQFTANERKVEVTGEVYFEIAATPRQPFTVNVNRKVEVAVLGTSFNVSAYNNEGSINTTLLEGKIKVIPVTQSPGTGSKEAILAPGQQAQVAIAQSASIKVVNNVPLQNITAWKNGLFNFNGITFEEGMRQIARWYDIQIMYENGIPQNIELSGEITMGISLQDLLAGFRDIGLQFRLEGRKLIIMSEQG